VKKIQKSKPEVQKHQKDGGGGHKGQKKQIMFERERETPPVHKKHVKKRKGRTSEIVTKDKTCTFKPPQQNSTTIQGQTDSTC
jgi:hypothetical protein